jgi:hypothetical protein
MKSYERKKIQRTPQSSGIERKFAMLPIIMSLHFSGCAAVSHSIGMTFHIMLLSFTATLGISALV